MMRIFQKKKKLPFLFLLGVLSTSFTTAYSNQYTSRSECAPDRGYNYRNNTCGWGCTPFEIGVSLIYFKPSIEDSHFVLSSIDNSFNGSQYPNGDRHQNCTSFSPGFRLEGILDICPNTSFWDLRFTYLTASSTKSVSGDFLYDTNGYPGFGAQDSPLYAGTARSKNSYKYYAGDLTYDRSFSCLFPDNFTFLVGLHTAYIKFKEHTIGVGSFPNDEEVIQPYSNDLERISQFFGIGPQIGINYQYILPDLCCMSGTWAFNAKTRGSLLSGYNNADLRYITLRTGPVGVRVHNHDFCWRIIPAICADLSLSYDLRCSCFCATIELGYEFNWYCRTVDKITGLETAFAGDTIDDFNNFSLQGPYLSVNFGF